MNRQRVGSVTCNSDREADVSKIFIPYCLSNEFGKRFLFTRNVVKVLTHVESKTGFESLVGYNTQFKVKEGFIFTCHESLKHFAINQEIFWQHKQFAGCVALYGPSNWPITTRVLTEGYNSNKVGWVCSKMADAWPFFRRVLTKAVQNQLQFALHQFSWSDLIFKVSGPREGTRPQVAGTSPNLWTSHFCHKIWSWGLHFGPCEYSSTNRPFSKMAAENSNKWKFKMYTSNRNDRHLYFSNPSKFQHSRCTISWENVSWKLKNLQTFVWLGV